MRSFFSPAIFVLNRLSYPQKFAFIGVLFAMPLAVVLYLLITEINHDIDFANKEVGGNTYLRPLRALLEDLQLHRGMTYAAYGGERVSDPDARLALRKRLDTDMNAIAEADRLMGPAFLTTTRWAALWGSWQSLRSDEPPVTAREEFDRHTQTIADLLLLMQEVGDGSNLILDPDLDSYYLMDTLVNQLPLQIEQLGQVRGLGAGALVGQTMDEHQVFHLNNLVGLIESLQTVIRRNFTVVLRENPGLRPHLETQIDESVTATNEFLAVVKNKLLLSPERMAISPKDYWDTGTRATKAAFRLHDATSPILDRVLQARIDRVSQKRFLVVMFTLAMMLVVLHLVMAFYLATMQTVARLRQVTHCVTSGKMDEILGLVETKDELGQITHSFSVLIQRLQAEWAHAQANEAWLSTTLRSIGDAVIVTDAQGRIMLMNDVAQVLTGWKEDDARGTALPEVFQIVLEGTHQPVESPVTKVVREGTVVGLANHTVLISKYGTECAIDDSAAPIRDRTGKISGVVLVFRDVTERKRGEDEQKQLRAQLLHNDKMAGVGQLAAGVAHEINNPIGFVRSNLNTLQEYVSDLFALIKSYERLEAATTAKLEGQSGQPEVVLVEIANIKQKIGYDAIAADLDHLLTESKDGIERVREIVQNLKEFSRVDEGTHKHADINHCVKSTLHMVWNELKYKAEITEDYGAIPEIFCSPGELNQVFMNLLVNAGQAIADKGCIGIRTFVKEKTIFVEISDTGCGILPQNLARIFEPFYTTKDVGKGTGLGLSISYGIMQKHKGRLEVESTVDQGTTFRVCLPIEESTITYAVSPAVQGERP